MGVKENIGVGGGRNVVTGAEKLAGRHTCVDTSREKGFGGH
jgi:hypothetical protein